MSPQTKGKNVKRQASMSERVGEMKSQRGNEDLFIPASGAKPRRAARASIKVALPSEPRKVTVDISMPDMPTGNVGREYHTYSLFKSQRALIEAHARYRVEIGFIDKIDYSQPLRDIIEFFQANEEEGNRFIANKYKNQGKR